MSSVRSRNSGSRSSEDRSPKSTDRSKSSGSGSQGSGSSNSGDRTVRGRAGYSRDERNYVPDNISQIKSSNTAGGVACEVLSNFIRINSMKEEQIYGYRVDFEPIIENVMVRRRLFNFLTADIFQKKVTFDGAHDAKSTHKIAQEQIKKEAPDPTRPNGTVTMILKSTGPITLKTYEELRMYGIQMKSFLRKMGLFAMGNVGSYVDPNLTSSLSNDLNIVRGFRTAAHYHEGGYLMMLEGCHKLMQKKNVRDIMMNLKKSCRPNQSPIEFIRFNMLNKLVVTSYNNEVYKIEDVDFTRNPQAKFHDRTSDGEISFIEYYERRYGKKIADQGQPLLKAVPNRKRRLLKGTEESNQVELVPELCLMAGLTEQQRSDNRLRSDLIRASQVAPMDKVNQLRDFIQRFHSNSDIAQMLLNWGYSYGNQLVDLKARILPTERIATGKTVKLQPNQWDPVERNTASFERLIVDAPMVSSPKFGKMAIVVPRSLASQQDAVISPIRRGFAKVGLSPSNVTTTVMEGGNRASDYVNHLRNLSDDVTAALVVFGGQDKERYDAVKKLASVERGLVTQVVTSRLLTDQRKANGAGVKIAIQIAAKIGGEPWHVRIPLKGAMICGYDTSHDTAGGGGKSFGAFVASMNDDFAQWYSKVDSHDRLDELSAHLAENFTDAMREYQKQNDGRLPDRVIIYRDGVGEGQLDHVFDVEVKNVLDALKNFADNIRLTYVIVNKQVGARFFMRNNNSYINCPPGTVIDDVVTRKNAYDFYLVSQSTRQGTIAPTYYTIVHDTSGLTADKHQMLAFKMCFLYFNWTGTVRVPAPCQYAHKLANLCGEHLHSAPNAILNDRLHFL